MYWLRTFGGFAIERDGTPADGSGVHRKALALLAVLAAQGSMGRERLMALLWPESNTGRAKGSLKQAVYVLRRQLGVSDLFLGTADLRLNPEHIQSDVYLFLKSLQDGDLATAVRFYTGPFLDGVYLERTPEFERWVETQRSELARRYMDALEQLARAAEARGEYALAAGWWRRLQGVDPLNSRVAVSLMTTLEASGDRAAALQHARVHETLLREEWGIDPDPAVAALADRLRSPSAPPPPRREPIATSSPETATQLADDRDAAAGGVAPPVEEPQEAAPAPRRTRLHRPALLTLVVVLGVGSALIVLARTGEQTVSASPQARAEPSLAAETASLVPEQGSIAVLPFVNMSSEQGQEYFSDGITEELISHLSKVKGLRVAARSSAFQFKEKNPDVREVGERLGVAHVLEGSVRKAGNQLRITAQLVSTKNGYQLWSETYERRTSDVFAVQDEISRAIVSALRLRLASSGTVLEARHPAANLEAYQLYLKGRFFWEQRSVEKALGYFEQAIAADPGFAPAYAELARTYTLSQKSPPAPRFAKARKAALTALALDSTLAAAHTALAWIQMWHDRDWAGAERSLQRALALDPSYAWARDWYSAYYAAVGQPRDAVVAVHQAIALDPLSPNMLTHLGTNYFWDGQYEQAAESFHKALELNPGLGHAHAGLARVHLQLGRYPEAIAQLRRGSGDNYAGLRKAALIGYAFALSGQTDGARHVLDDLLHEARTGYVPPINVAIVYLGLGEREQALRWLERIPEDRGTMIFLKVDPIYDPLRSEPRFQRLLRTLGLA